MLVQDIRYARENVAKNSEAILDEVSAKIKTLMEQLAPVRTGRLRNSITIIKNPGYRNIGPQGVPYAVYQEFGTATRGEFGGTVYVIKPKTPGGLLHFQVNEEWVSAKEVHHPGIPPHPYARPAARQGLANIAEKYAVMGAEILMQGRRYGGYRDQS